MREPLQNLLKTGAASWGLTPDEQALGRFGILMEELLEWNKVMNLTSITEPEEIVVKHFLDSLSLFSCLPQVGAGEAELIDVGCGAGFPGLPLLIAFPGLKVTFLDGLNKRLQFIEAVCEKMGVPEARRRCLHARAEDAGRLPEHREHYDFAVARAVAGLPVLAEYCLPFVKIGGVFAAMKGPAAEEEREGAQKALRELGGREESAREFELPFSEARRTVIVVKKIASTPPRYPRTQAKIKKAPL